MNRLDSSCRVPRSALACAVILYAVAAPVPAADKPVTHAVIIKATSYSPAALTVKRGDTVVWRNEDPFPHTASAAQGFDSKSIAAGGSWKFIARTAGDYPYTCTFHPNMKATLRVE